MSSSAKPPRSLHRELLVWLLAPLLAVFAVNSVLGYRVSIATANSAYDRLLLASAKAIADRVTMAGGEITVDIPYAALELFESNIRERIFYKVSAPDGTTITGYEDLPLPPAGGAGKPLFFHSQYHGESLYQAALYKPLYSPTLKGMVLVQVAETAESREALTRQILYDSLLPQGLLIAFAAVFLLLGVRRALMPLSRLRDSVAQREPGDLAPVDGTDVHSEVRPLIDALNAHTARIDRMIAARVAFVADAAHQIRTRMSIITTQLEYGQRLDEHAALRDVVEHARAMVGEAAHFFNQLLALARAEASPPRQERVDVAALAHAVALEWVPPAREKQINLGYEGPEHGLHVRGDARALSELLANLLDNAIRYTEPGGTVTLHAAEDTHVRIVVEDNGPGIPESDRARAFERFSRIGSPDSGGSGLGLAIALEICRSHHGTIELGTPPTGRGLLVTISLPRFDVTGVNGRKSASPSA